MVKKTRHCVYHINYHFVWCPKYRRHVLVGQIRERLKELLHDCVTALDGEIIEMVIQSDHIHLFVSFPPSVAPSQAAHRLKGATSFYLRREFPKLKRFAKTLWTPSYYVGTAGHVSSEAIEKYINAQKGQS